MTVVYAVYFFSFSSGVSTEHENPARNGDFLFNPYGNGFAVNYLELVFRCQLFDIGVALGVTTTGQKLEIAVFQVFDRKNWSALFKWSSINVSA